MKSPELTEFFSLLGKAKKEKKEEFDNLLKEADINLDVLTSTVVTGIKEAKVKQKKQKKNEEKLIEQLDSIIDVIENPIIQSIKISGVKNKAIESKLIEVTKKSEKYPFLESNIRKQKNLLLNIIRTSGFYFVEMDTNIIDNGDSTIDIIYNFNLGNRAKIKKIDGARTPTTHTISANDTIEKIAFRYGFSLREIEIANAIYPGSRKLVAGDKEVIPNRFHIVKEGQNLNSIAERYNLSATQLASYNSLDDENIILIGDKLLLPFFIHVTNENETIADIGKRYEREISELIEFNAFDKNTVILNENQLVKIPIYTNENISYENLDKKSINDFQIDRKNLAIIEISNSEFMVREGDRIGNRDGVIVSIEKNRMIVLEDNIEYEFLINTPIVGMAIASLPQSNNEDIINDDVNNDDTNIENQTDNNDNNNDNEGETVTNVEDLFN